MSWGSILAYYREACAIASQTGASEVERIGARWALGFGWGVWRLPKSGRA